MKEGEVEGMLTFAVEKSKALHLSDDAAGVRWELFWQIEELAELRKDNDASYFNVINKGDNVMVVLPFPKGYEAGGWGYAMPFRCKRVLPTN